MRLPIKLNDAFWPRVLRHVVGPHLRRDPRLLLDGEANGPSQRARTEAISAFKFGTTFKTTADRRHRDADELLLDDGVDRDEVILDVGASDGITSLNLIDRLGESFRRFYVTDYNLSVIARRRGRWTFFFDPRGSCVLVADPLFVYYPDEAPWLRASLRFAMRDLPEGTEVKLVQPELMTRAGVDPRVEICAYDVLSPWSREAPSVVKVANVLNPAYFAPETIRRAIANLHQMLPTGGRLLLIENRARTQAGLYRREDQGFVDIRLLEQPDIHELVVEPVGT